MEREIWDVLILEGWRVCHWRRVKLLPRWLAFRNNSVRVLFASPDVYLPPLSSFAQSYSMESTRSFLLKVGKGVLIGIPVNQLFLFVIFLWLGLLGCMRGSVFFQSLSRDPSPGGRNSIRSVYRIYLFKMQQSFNVTRSFGFKCRVYHTFLGIL